MAWVRAIEARAARRGAAPQAAAIGPVVPAGEGG